MGRPLTGELWTCSRKLQNTKKKHLVLIIHTSAFAKLPFKKSLVLPLKRVTRLSESKEAENILRPRPDVAKIWSKSIHDQFQIQVEKITWVADSHLLQHVTHISERQLAELQKLWKIFL